MTVVSSCSSSRPMDTKKWRVESAYCEHMTRIRDASLTLETILEQLVQDGEGIVYAFTKMKRVRL